ncbi:uncharacterized protein PHACADRAFT_259285 [Phanerochaete carnosa HHB-10118-sp]|uniref:Transmembrane protein n=1 Tax=Phanerochaete carnosa (strain HHB-10118-sp) TaxID=650164 RepID=K5W1V7_PHACS|nr:uncharacterized protein PHACADRAFT_259285 [Phanerochaete carnosa HHB-10118-sp]EKM53110.1 hypothetical protein PHACADRAFT_259285 [Phanerochaete carnosa HHB-10118-sp]
MAVNIERLQQGFLTIGPNLPGGPEQYFANFAQRTFLIKSVLFNCQTLILDFAVIYRAYTVWQNVYIIILPALGWCGLFAASFGTNFVLGTASANGAIFNQEVGVWITANYSMTLATNVIATSLLAYRIWMVKRETSRFLVSHALSPLLRVVIESGAIYSLTVTAALITFVTKSNGVYVMLDMISPIISIVFNMIIVRVGLAREQGLSAQSGEQSGSHRVPGSSFGFRPSRPQYGQTSLAVEITQFIETDGDVTEDTLPIELKAKQDSYVAEDVKG